LFSRNGDAYIALDFSHRFTNYFDFNVLKEMLSKYWRKINQMSSPP
jgi:hypothetical protein